MSFLVGNTLGSFALFGIASRFQGVFFSDGQRMFKTIAEIDSKLKREGMQTELWRVTQEAKGVQERLWFAHRLPLFFYELSKDVPVDIVLDCKENFDNREWGRNYAFSEEKGVMLVHFKKTFDAREEKREDVEFWLGFYGASFEKLDAWEERAYAYDEARQSPPFKRFVLRALRAKGSFVMAFAKSKEEARGLALQAWRQKKVLEEEAQKVCAEAVSKESVATGEVRRALQCARYSLLCLRTGQGIYAGYPWFHQRWARDELVCAKALMLSGQKSLARVILFSWLKAILPDGKLPGTLTRAISDSGWLFLRLENALRDLTEKEKEWVLSRLEFFLQQSEAHLVDGLVYSGVKESWMDSLERAGPRIEIEALVLAAARLVRKMKKASPFESKLKARVKAAFWKNGYLADGAFDDVVRPNVFIAAYAYPELLTKREWVKCFDAILPKLWCSWGGLATIDKSHPEFTGVHTGENPKSYHNGDSWYWVNNLAALVLLRTDRKKYQGYIDHVLKASTKEILHMGAIAHHAEVSSAKEQTSSGCLAQGWSAAMYVELVEEYFTNLNKS